MVTLTDPRYGAAPGAGVTGGPLKATADGLNTSSVPAPIPVKHIDQIIVDRAINGHDLDTIRKWVTYRALARDAMPTQAETDASNMAISDYRRTLAAAQ